MREINPLHRPDQTYNYYNTMCFEIDHSPLATQTAELFEQIDNLIDNLNAEDYAYFLAHGELPESTDSVRQTTTD